MAGRCVAHLDMDAFYVSVELRRRPELRGRPVIVAGTGPRSVVTTASYEARRFGVGSAMPAARARRLCPHGVFLAPDFAYYREASRQVMATVRNAVETVEVVGLDEAKLVAKVASDAEKPRGFVVLSREQACWRFGPAPCGLVPGIGPKTVERLRALGIDTLAALAAAPPDRLAARFGPRLAAELQRRARFEDDSPVTEERKVVSESRELTFDEDIRDPARLEGVLAQLVDRLCEGLVAQRRRGRTIGIKIRLDDFSTHTRARTLTEAVASADRVGPVALDLLRRFAAPRPVRLLGVRVAGLELADRADDEQLQLVL
jgi:DNA polymerase-4